MCLCSGSVCDGSVHMFIHRLSLCLLMLCAARSGSDTRAVLLYEDDLDGGLGGRGWAFFELWLDSRRWRVLGAGRHGRKARHDRMGYWRSQKSKTSRARHPHTNQCAKPEFTFIDKFKMGCLSPWQRAVSSSSVVGDSCLGVCLMYIIISSCKIVFV